MFDDEVEMGFFDVYDQYLLKILYDPGSAQGRKGRSSLIAPEITPAVRAWVATT